MTSSSSKLENMKPFLFKAGIPLTLSVAAFIYARIAARRGVPKDPTSETRANSMEADSQFECDESFYSLSSCCPSAEYDLVEEILGLKGRIEDLQKRESELEMRFMRYSELKEQESVLTKLMNMMLLEMAQIELLDREISLMEDETRRLEKFFADYSRLLEQLEYWKSKSGLLERKVKNLSRRKRLQSNHIRERDLKIRAGEAELLKTREALETRTNDVEKLEDEIGELRMVLDQMQEEKNELLNKLESEEQSASSFSKIEAKGMTTEDENRPENEIEELKKDQEWSNSRIRNEFLMNQEHQNRTQQKGDLEIDLQGNFELENHALEQELDGITLEHNDQVCSKRKKLLKRLRRWVEGSEKEKGKVEEREKHEVKCFRRHSVAYEAEEHLQGRRSYSSA